VRAILRAGLTGGIASGKTTVAGIFAEHGAFVLDADAIAHDLMRPGGAAYHDVVARFGPGILDADGVIVRPALGRIVFHDPEARRALDALVHPRILPEAERRIASYLTAGHALICVLDAALLVESGLYRRLDRLVVARCSRATQLRRLTARDGFTEDEADARIAAQAPLESKLAVADYVVDTDGTLRHTRDEAGRVWHALMADYEKLFGDAASRGSQAP
jgi:dephospho-CoA kinase